MPSHVKYRTLTTRFINARLFRIDTWFYTLPMPPASPRFGNCGPIDCLSKVLEAGFSHLEIGIVATLKPHDSDFDQSSLPEISPGTITTANMMLPGDIAVVGPAVDEAKILAYAAVMFTRAQRLGVRTIVFGAGRSRRIPEGFSPEEARRQIVHFLRMIAPIALAHRITIAIEHLNKRETNIITSFAEAASYLPEVDQPNVRLLFDTYHAWVENEPLTHLRQFVSKLAHVHLADRDGRFAPGETGRSDYRPVFRILREANYTGDLSIEARDFNPAVRGKAVLEFLTHQWNTAI